MKSMDQKKDIERIGALIDNELRPFERLSALRAIRKHKDLEDLEEKLGEQKNLIKEAFSKGFLVE